MYINATKRCREKNIGNALFLAARCRFHTDENDVYINDTKAEHDHQPNCDLIQAKRLRQEMQQTCYK